MPASLMAVFNNLLFGVGEIFHSNVWWSRALAMRPEVGRRAYLLAGAFWLPVPVAAGFIALNSSALGINVTSPDMVGPQVAAAVLGRGGALVVFVVAFCSLASSVDSLLAATADLITEDIYRKLINPDAGERSTRRASASIVVGLGLVAWLVCLPRVGTLATVLFFAGPMVGSTIWPMATGLYWRRASTGGALGGMLAGSACGLWAYFALGWYTASLVGAAVSMLVVVAASARSREAFDWTALNEAAPDPVPPRVAQEGAR
jgi:Na+/proline symporter